MSHTYMYNKDVAILAYFVNIPLYDKCIC